MPVYNTIDLNFFFCIFRAMPIAYRGSQAKGRIGAVATSLHHSHTATPDPSHVCNLHHSSWQCRILNPLDEARARTHIFMDTGSICYP